MTDFFVPDMNSRIQLVLPAFSSPKAAILVWSAPRIATSGLVSGIHRFSVKSDKSYWLEIREEYSAHAQKIGSGQRSPFLVLPKRSAASVHESAFPCVSDAKKVTDKTKSELLVRIWIESAICTSKLLINSRLICSLKVHGEHLKVSCAAWAEMKTPSAGC